MKNILLRIKSIQYLLYRIFGFLQGSYTSMFRTLRMLKRGRMLKTLLNQIEQIKKRRCDKTLKTSVVEAEKRTNRASIDSEVFELASRHHTARLFWNPIMQI